MATKQELITEFIHAYDIVDYVEHPPTTDGHVIPFSIWHRVNNIIMFMRVNMYVKNGDYSWYGSNPICEYVETFQDKLQAKITWILETVSSIKYLAIDSIDSVNNNAIVIGYNKPADVYIEIKVFAWLNEQEEIEYHIMEF